MVLLGSQRCCTLDLTGGCNHAGGADRLHEFRRVVDFPTLKATGGSISFKGFSSGELWIALATFLYVDFLDTTGTLFSMASFINNYVPGVLSPCKLHARLLRVAQELGSCSGKGRAERIQLPYVR